MGDRLSKYLPPNVVKQCIFVQGGAFRRKWEYGGEGQKWRYFFVLNKSPQDDDHLILVTCTTKVRKTFKKFCCTSLVRVTRAEYDSLEKESVINCSLPEMKPRDYILAAIEKGEVTVLSPLPEDVMKRILKAVETASTISPKVKRLVLGSDDAGRNASR